MVLLVTLAGLLVFSLPYVWARDLSRLQRALANQAQALDATEHSLNVSSCPGYSVVSIDQTDFGLTAQLGLAGPACNAFGTDFADLTVQVTYETETRLHVNIFDSGNSNFVIPESIVSRPSPPTSSFLNSSDLVFNHDPSPFAFWVTRRSDPDGTPLFDTRPSSLPPTPIAPVIEGDNSTALDAFPLVFEDQYLQLTSALPLGANIYGLGEVVASSGFRRDVGTTGNGTIQTMWARDEADPIDGNEYGIHPFYLEHRLNSTTGTSTSHGVFLLSAAGSDVLLLTPPSSSVSLIEYRQLGGALDFYFFSGRSSKEVVEQYSEVVGTPTWQPYWGFGFHLCRWGYANVSETMAQVTAMREANIPLEVMWNDIDLYLALRDFTSDPVSFPGDQMRSFIQELASNNQRYIPIVDAAVAHTTNSSDDYAPYIVGSEQKVFVTNPDGSEYIGQVWPGYTVFPDWFANNTQAWWTEALQNWTNSGIEFSGIWLDMNEASSFCDGSCGSGANLSDISSMRKRGIGSGNQTGVDLNTPPYAIHNGDGRLSINTLATNATHAGGYTELDVHNLFGTMEEITTHKALLDIIPGKRPFIIGRSTFASAGKWTGHWLGDNFSLWSYMHYAIQGVLQFQLFQIPMVGPDTCGFNDNTTEELCNRWMQLSAFVPFYRNHNTKGALSQEPYRWDSVANASRTAMAARYALLPYWYSLFANASLRGTPPVRAMFFEFPDEEDLFGIDAQFMIGADILVTPVLTENATTVEGIFPGNNTIWRDWWTHEVLNATVGTPVTLDAPLGHINVHIRDGSAILLHSEPGYTTTESRDAPYALLVSQAADGYAMGQAYIDDGISVPPGPSTTLNFVASTGKLTISSDGAFNVTQPMSRLTVLGAATEPSQVTVGGTSAGNFTYTASRQELVVEGLNLDMNQGSTIEWS